MTAHRHAWVNRQTDDGVVAVCSGCMRTRDAEFSSGGTLAISLNSSQTAERLVRSRRGRNNRKRGIHHELEIARRYGGTKVGPLGQPFDIVGPRFVTQVKTHQRMAPAGWTSPLNALAPSAGARCPRLIVRFLQPGVPADDFIIIRGVDWLDYLGRDE